MTIGVDAGMLGVTDERLKVGVWRVAYNLLKQLTRLDTKNIYRLYSFYPFGEFGQNVVLARSGFLKLRIPFELRKNPVDLFIGFAQALPPMVNAPSIVYIHDLGFNTNKKLESNTRNATKHATHLVAVSHWTKRNIFKFYGRVDATVIYNGVDKIFSPKGKKYLHPRPYFLFVGSLNKAKNIPFLLESFAKTRGLDLILVGGDYWPDPSIEDSINRLKLEDRVIITGHVSDRELHEYYRGALAFVTAAVHEGFCLPAVESMASGTPVIGVNRGALPEIVGDAGLIVEPQNLSWTLNKMSGGRSRLAKLSIKRAKLFSWETSTKKLLALIEAHAHKEN